jgi:hypothetical protein
LKFPAILIVSVETLESSKTLVKLIILLFVVTQVQFSTLSTFSILIKFFPLFNTNQSEFLKKSSNSHLFKDKSKSILFASNLSIVIFCHLSRIVDSHAKLDTSANPSNK